MTWRSPRNPSQNIMHRIWVLLKIELKIGKKTWNLSTYLRIQEIIIHPVCNKNEKNICMEKMCKGRKNVNDFFSVKSLTALLEAISYFWNRKWMNCYKKVGFWESYTYHSSRWIYSRQWLEFHRVSQVPVESEDLHII